MKRIQFLDGFRGIAILWVVLYHTFSRWSNLMPFNAIYSKNLLLVDGWLGVYLFFLISGFVILLTLERSKNFGTFIKNRWIRLFPSMLICVTIIYLTRNFFFERPNGVPKLIDVLPGLTFLDPFFYREFLHLPLGTLEGAFWSIYVEVKFYIIFGLMYFYLGKTKSILGIFILFIVYNLVYYLNLNIDNSYLKLLEMICYKLGFSYFGWFTTGTLVYLYFGNKTNINLKAAVIAGILSVFGLKENPTVLLLAFIMLTLFIATCKFKFLQKIIANKIFLFIGFISYPYYLLHENITISTIIKTHRHFPELSTAVLVLLPVLLIISFVYPYTKYIEPNIQKKIKSIMIKK